MRIATGEETETLPADDGKDPAAKALGEKGGARSRPSSMTPKNVASSKERDSPTKVDPDL
jgi:hypothetical protein